jgi:hypothetical protein
MEGPDSEKWAHEEEGDTGRDELCRRTERIEEAIERIEKHALNTYKFVTILLDRDLKRDKK